MFLKKIWILPDWCISQPKSHIPKSNTLARHSHSASRPQHSKSWPILNNRKLKETKYIHSQNEWSTSTLILFDVDTNILISTVNMGYQSLWLQTHVLDVMWCFPHMSSLALLSSKQTQGNHHSDVFHFNFCGTCTLNLDPLQFSDVLLFSCLFDSLASFPWRIFSSFLLPLRS